MARSRRAVRRRLLDLLSHTATLPPEAAVPIRHYRHTSRNLWLTREYFEDGIRKHGKFVEATLRKHLSSLDTHGYVAHVSTLERFLKEAAAACIDILRPFILDDRLDAFRVPGSALAAHYGADTLGRALCEPMTWLDTTSVNGRFRTLLADPHEEGRFLLFPYGKKDDPEDRERFETLELVWQFRHTIAHNVGIITGSDALKLRLLARAPVTSPLLIVPTRDDIHFLKRFLDDTATVCNERIGKRLAEVLTALHGGDTTLFAPREMADRVSAVFGVPLEVAGAMGTVPPP